MVVEKQKGIVNEIVYDRIAIEDGKYMQGLTIGALRGLFNSIIESEATTKHIRITPYYFNAKHRIDEELEEFMFFIECREKVTKEDIKERLGSVIVKKHYELTEEDRQTSDYVYKRYEELTAVERRVGRIMNPLVEYKDIKGFGEALLEYWDFLIEVQIQEMMNVITNQLDIDVQDYIFGYICFGIHSK